VSGSQLKKNEEGFPAFRLPALILWQGPRNMAASERRTMSEGLLLRRLGFLLAVILVSIAVGAPSQCAQKSSDAQTTPKTNSLDDAMKAMFDVRTFAQAEISPDGNKVAWVESLPGPGGAPSANSAIYVAEVSAPDARTRITAGDGKTAYEEHDVAWSPDGKQIAFLSDASTQGQLQLFVMNSSGGSAKQVTHMKGFLASPGWSPDGKTVALLFTENATRAAGPLVAETPDEGVVSEEFLEQRLTLVDPAAATVRQISPADMYVYEFDWAPDSNRLVITAAHGNGDNNWYIAGLFKIDAASGAMTGIVAKPGMQIGVPKWSPNGRTIAFIGGLMSDEPIVGGDVYLVPEAGGNAENITPNIHTTASWLTWTPDSKKVLIAQYADGVSAIHEMSLDRSSSLDTFFDGSILSGDFGMLFSISGDAETIGLIRQSFDKPPEVWVGKSGEWKQITHRNDGLRLAWGKSVSLHWTTDIGKVQGWLTYPNDFDPAKKYPLIVRVHGGPSWAVTPAWPTRWSYAMALPSQGYFVFQPNPRGSYGQGEKFAAANVKDFGYGDFRDIMAGVDEAIKSAPVDPERIGLTGWSYGGYMTMWGVTQTNRFRAAVAGAGLSDWLSYYGENKIDQWMPPFFGANVYDDPAVYAKSSPITFIKNVKTPTLVVVGDSDGECPPPQSYEFWHALKTTGVPTQFVIYPHEGHEFADPAHSRDVIERAVGWFNQYLQPSR
jgi:dipeptidyl aminopeptidase/acylaminoacyl peptidase